VVLRARDAVEATQGAHAQPLVRLRRAPTAGGVDPA
jgi:hypothetical protein